MSNEEIAAAIADVENRAKSNTHRLDKMEERQDNLDKLVAAVAGVQKIWSTRKAMSQKSREMSRP